MSERPNQFDVSARRVRTLFHEMMDNLPQRKGPMSKNFILPKGTTLSMTVDQKEGSVRQMRVLGEVTLQKPVIVRIGLSEDTVVFIPSSQSRPSRISQMVLAEEDFSQQPQTEVARQTLHRRRESLTTQIRKRERRLARRFCARDPQMRELLESRDIDPRTITGVKLVFKAPHVTN